MSNKLPYLKKHVLNTTVLLALGAMSTATYAAVSALDGNFTMLDSNGNQVGGTNDVAFTWDGTLNTDPATATSNATIASATPTPFFGVNWTAYNVKVYGPGTYTLSTVDTLGSADCPFAPSFACVSAGDYVVTAAAGQLVAHMKFAWGATQGIDVVDVWDVGSWTAFNPPGAGTNAIFIGPGGTYTGPVYNLLSTDWDGDTKAGSGMIDGPFAGFNANFSVNAGSTVIGVDPCKTDPNSLECEPKQSAINPKKGCSISSEPVNTRDHGEWWLIGGFLAWLGMIVRRRRHNAN